MNDLENIKNVNGYEVTVFIEENNYEKLKEKAKNKNTTIDLLLENIIEDKLKDCKNTVKYNYFFLMSMFDTMKADFVDEKKQKDFEMFYQSILDRGLKNARK